jgi:hypothetical protein
MWFVKVKLARKITSASTPTYDMVYRNLSHSLSIPELHGDVSPCYTNLLPRKEKKMPAKRSRAICAQTRINRRRMNHRQEVPLTDMSQGNSGSEALEETHHATLPITTPGRCQDDASGEISPTSVPSPPFTTRPLIRVCPGEIHPPPPDSVEESPPVHIPATTEASSGVCSGAYAVGSPQINTAHPSGVLGPVSPPINGIDLRDPHNVYPSTPPLILTLPQAILNIQHPDTIPNTPIRTDTQLTESPNPLFNRERADTVPNIVPPDPTDPAPVATPPDPPRTLRNRRPPEYYGFTPLPGLLPRQPHTALAYTFPPYRRGNRIVEGKEIDLNSLTPHSLGDFDRTCPHCGAKFFPSEAGRSGYTRCCKSGKIFINPERPPPPQILDLAMNSKCYRRNNIKMNNMVSMASLGVKFGQFIPTERKFREFRLCYR